MQRELTYKQAYAELEALVAQLEAGGVELEELAVKIKQANELIGICEAKLRMVDDEIGDAMNDSNKRQDE